MPTTATPTPSLFRRMIGAVACCAVLGGIVWQAGRWVERGPGWIPVDFLAFWTAGRLHLEGRNAYDQDAVRDVQVSQVDGVGEAVIMWSTPWALFLVLPFSALPLPAAASAWFLIHLALLIGAADLLWRAYGGAPSRRWVAWLLGFTLAPTIYLIAYGQLTTVPLIGVAGFLICVRRNRYFWAGVFGGLTAAKPNLFALFALAVVLESFRSREGRKILLGGLCLGVVTSALMSLSNPRVFVDYVTAMAGSGSDIHRSVGEWEPPLVGWYLRQFVPGKPFAVQFLPAAVAAIAFLGYWWTHRKTWDWLRVMPWVVGFSLLVAPYGAWAHDGVLLLVPVLAAATRIDLYNTRARAALTVYLLANAVGYATYLAHATGETYVWQTPVILLVCALVPARRNETLRQPDARIRPPLNLFRGAAS